MQVIKAKKRRLGRAQKTIGDYSLLAGSPVDANAHYSTALELARLTGDYFWYAGALEGTVCALLVRRYANKNVNGICLEHLIINGKQPSSVGRSHNCICSKTIFMFMLYE